MVMRYRVVFVSRQIALLDSPTALSMEEKLQQNEARVTPPLPVTRHASTHRSPWPPARADRCRYTAAEAITVCGLCSPGSGADQGMDQQVERDPEHPEGEGTPQNNLDLHRERKCLPVNDPRAERLK